MAVAGLVKGTEILRREIGKETKVVLVDVGSLTAVPIDEHLKSSPSTPEPISTALTRTGGSYHLQETTASKVRSPRRQHRRTPADVEVFTRAVVGVVISGRPFTLHRHVWTRFKTWVRGDRFGVGAGAHTYIFASFLPSFVLEALLGLPSRLRRLRKQLSNKDSAPHATTPPLAKKVTRDRKILEDIAEEKLSPPSSSPPQSLPSSRPVSISSMEGSIHEEENAKLAESIVNEARPDVDASDPIAESWVSLGGQTTSSHS